MLTACHTVNKQEKDDTSDVPPDTVEVSPDTITMVQDTAMCDSTATINGAEVTDVDTDTTIVYYYDTIIGRFRPGIVDTLIVEVSELRYEDYYECSNYKMYSPSGIAAPFDSHSSYDFILSNKGDLDGNGTDELFVCGRSMSCCTSYYVITYRDGRWYEMIEPIYINICIESERGPLVSKSDIPGYIKARAIRPDCEPYVDEWIVDSLMPIIYKPLDY